MTQHRKIDARQSLVYEIFDLIDELDNICNFYDAVWADLLHSSPRKGIDYAKARETAIITYWESINVLRRKMMALSERYSEESK